jgi:hypothetical protein
LTEESIGDAECRAFDDLELLEKRLIPIANPSTTRMGVITRNIVNITSQLKIEETRKSQLRRLKAARFAIFDECVNLDDAFVDDFEIEGCSSGCRDDNTESLSECGRFGLDIPRWNGGEGEFENWSSLSSSDLFTIDEDEDERVNSIEENTLRRKRVDGVVTGRELPCDGLFRTNDDVVLLLIYDSVFESSLDANNLRFPRRRYGTFKLND